MTALTGWPFWAPSDLAAVEHALDLAELQPGEHLVDLGCGDGQVLVAAASRGCTVSGVECDADLVDHARLALAENELEGEVVLGDVFEFPLDDADVIFTYLAPATLQRLVDRFQRADGARLVTVDFAVPGLEPEVVDGANHLYRLPAPEAAPDTPGWQADGILVGVTPDRHSLTCLTLHHPGGPATVEVTGTVAAAVTVATGADEARAGEEIAVDLRWEELDAGSFYAGALRCDGLDALPLYAFVTNEEAGTWEVTPDGVERLQTRLASGWQPVTLAELVAGCDAD